MDGKKKMVFRKLGGRYQIRIDSPEDLHAVCGLDEALWMCTGAPVESFTCEPAFLKYLDSDGNGRIRTDEVKTALKWMLSVLSDYSVLSSDKEEFPLSAINTSGEAGKLLRSSAERILENLEVADKNFITVAQTRSRQDILSSGECNGDGVIPAVSVDDSELRGFIQDIMATVGEALDAGGQKGIKSGHLDMFMTQADEYVKWHEKGCLKTGEKSSCIMVRGDATPATYSALKNLEAKIDEFFAQCRLLKVDPAASAKFATMTEELKSLRISDINAIENYTASMPLAEPNTEENLVFDDNLNPFYRESAAVFTDVLLHTDKKKRSGVTTLSFKKWDALKEEFADFAEWESGKPEGTVEKLGIDKLRKYLEGGLADRLKPLFEKDLAVAEEIKRISEVEKLLLYARYLPEFTNNFVSLASLYDPSALSMIQTGKLVMDGRHFDLNVKIKDKAAHKKIAAKSNICVMYINLTAKDGSNAMKADIATAVTSGHVANLYIGKRGVFFTPDGREWDAEVTDFIQQPVSVTEALKMPFVKLGAFLKQQTEKFTSSTYGKIETGLGKGVSNIEKTIQTPASPAKPAPAAGSPWTGPLMLLGGGIGLAGLGSAFASVVNALKDNAVVFRILLFMLGVVMLISIPIIISAMLKLRKRNIGMFLEACGWSVNSPMRLNWKLGLLFTRIPAYPENSEREIFDAAGALLKQIRFEKKSVLGRLLLIVIILLISFGIGYSVRKLLHTDVKIVNAVQGK